MSVTDFNASDLRSPPEMQMRSYDWAVADRVPVVETTCCAVFPVQGNRYF